RAIGKVENRIHHKILLVTAIAALAEGRFPDLPDGEKFRKLVDEHGDWPDGHRVSPIQLKLHVEDRRKLLKRGGYTQPFMDAVDAQFAQMEREQSAGEVRRVDQDPLPNEILPQTPTEDERRAIAKAQHFSLLYQYRSTLVHEFREPGGFEVDQRDTVPF